MRFWGTGSSHIDNDSQRVWQLSEFLVFAPVPIASTHQLMMNLMQSSLDRATTKSEGGGNFPNSFLTSGSQSITWGLDVTEWLPWLRCLSIWIYLFKERARLLGSTALVAASRQGIALLNDSEYQGGLSIYDFRRLNVFLQNLTVHQRVSIGFKQSCILSW